MLLKCYWLEYEMFIQVKKLEKSSVCDFFIKKCRN